MSGGGPASVVRPDYRKQKALGSSNAELSGSQFLYFAILCTLRKSSRTSASVIYISKKAYLMTRTICSQATYYWHAIAIFTVVTTKVCCKTPSDYKPQYCNTLQSCSIIYSEGGHRLANFDLPYWFPSQLSFPYDSIFRWASVC
jgi:hypothetical protein